jgi:hypothetical protein
MAAMTWDRAGLGAHQREQGRLLRDWIEHEVGPFSAYWGQRLAGRAVRSLDALRELPVVTEAEIAAAGGPGNPELLLLPTEDGFKRHATRGELLAAAREVGKGGAAGRRAALFRRYKPVHVHEAGVEHLVAIAYTRSDLDRLHLAGARLMEVLGLGADDTMVSALPAGPSVSFWGLYHAALAARMTALHPRGAGQSALRPVLRGLAMLPTTVLAVPAGEAADLLAMLRERGVRLEGLRTLVTVGPPPAPTQRVGLARAAELLGSGAVRVQAVWAPEMSRTLWAECRPATADPHEATYGLHTYPDMEVVEVRDVERDDDAVEGAEGEIVLTSLGWRGTALLRVATGAWTGGLSVSSPCPACGRTVPRLAPAAADAAWQPRVRAGTGRTVRADLRQCYRVLTPETAGRLRVRSWSLRPDRDRLVLAVDAENTERELLWELTRRVGEAVGADVQLRVDPQLAATSPKVGGAGTAP